MGPGRRRNERVTSGSPSSEIGIWVGWCSNRSRSSPSRAGIIRTGVAVMTRIPKNPTSSRSGTAPAVLMAATIGLEARNPMMPPALRILSAPSGGLGRPAEMWTRPAAAKVTTVVPIVTRFVDAWFSGARNSRIPNSSNAIGITYAIRPKVPATTAWTTSPVVPLSPHHSLAPVYKKYDNPTTTILAAAGDLQIHLRARCSTEGEAAALLVEVGGPIELLLGDRIYSRNGQSLEEVVGDM